MSVFARDPGSDQPSPEGELPGLGNAVADMYGFSLLNRLIPDELAGRAWARSTASPLG